MYETSVDSYSGQSRGFRCCRLPRLGPTQPPTSLCALELISHHWRVSHFVLRFFLLHAELLPGLHIYIYNVLMRDPAPPTPQERETSLEYRRTGDEDNWTFWLSEFSAGYRTAAVLVYSFKFKSAFKPQMAISGSQQLLGVVSNSTVTEILSFCQFWCELLWMNVRCSG